MSRMYEMVVTVYGQAPTKRKAIEAAAKKEWNFDDVEVGCDNEGNPTSIWARGGGSLCGGESEEEFAKRLTQAIWKANGKFCRVQIAAINLDPPTTSHELNEEDYTSFKESK